MGRNDPRRVKMRLLHEALVAVRDDPTDVDAARRLVYVSMSVLQQGSGLVGPEVEVVLEGVYGG